MFAKLSFTLIACCSIASAASAEPSQARAPLDPNEKICEKIKPVGSRLATKRVCATRAEWADYRRQDRDALDKAQRLTCLTQAKCGGN